MKKRIMAIILSLCMMASLLPMSALAGHGGGSGGGSTPGGENSQDYASWWPLYWSYNNNVTGNVTTAQVTVQTGGTTVDYKGSRVSPKTAFNDTSAATVGEAITNGIQVTVEEGYYLDSYRIVCGNFTGCGAKAGQVVTPIQPDSSGNYSSTVTINVTGKANFSHNVLSGKNNYHVDEKPDNYSDDYAAESYYYDLSATKQYYNQYYPYYLLLNIKEDTRRYSVEYNWGELADAMAEADVSVPSKAEDLKYNADHTAATLTTRATETALAQGKVFNGWAISGGNYPSGSTVQEGRNVAVTGNLTLTAQWIDDPTPYYNISIDVVNGTSDPDVSSIPVREGSDATISFSANQGYKLGSVTVDDEDASLTDGSYTFSDVNGSHAIKVYYVKDNSLTHSVRAQVEYYYGDTLEAAKAKTEADATDEVKTANGWIGGAKKVTVTPNTTNKFPGYTYNSTDGDLEYTVAAGVESDPITHIVKVYYVKADYTVTYDSNGGSLPEGTANTVSYKYSESLGKDPTPTRSGYSFEKWTWYKAGADDKPTGDPFEKKPANMPAYNLIAVAQWKENGGGPSHTTKYTLTYETNGGSKIDSERYTAGSTAKLTKVPVRENYTFTGWYEDEGLTKKITEIKMNSNKTVYAGWEATEVPGMLNGNDHFAYVIGYPDGNVKPMGNITRAEVATIFFRLLKDDVRDGNLTTTNVFNDVNEGNWFNTAISTMAKLGIVNGRTADTFAPNAPITRAEFAAICARFDTSIDMGASSFTDIDGHWAKDDIEHAVSLGWIMGYEDNTFRPNNLITRAEAMTMINRVLCRMPEVPEDLLSDMNIWPDNSDTSKWYYLPIQEATNSHDFKKKGEIYETWTTLTDDPDWSRYQN